MQKVSCLIIRTCTTSHVVLELLQSHLLLLLLIYQLENLLHRIILNLPVLDIQYSIVWETYLETTFVEDAHNTLFYLAKNSK